MLKLEKEQTYREAIRKMRPGIDVIMATNRKQPHLTIRETLLKNQEKLGKLIEGIRTVPEYLGMLWNMTEQQRLIDTKNNRQGLRSTHIARALFFTLRDYPNDLNLLAHVIQEGRNKTNEPIGEVPGKLSHLLNASADGILVALHPESVDVPDIVGYDAEEICEQAESLDLEESDFRRNWRSIQPDGTSKDIITTAQREAMIKIQENSDVIYNGVFEDSLRGNFEDYFSGVEVLPEILGYAWGQLEAWRYYSEGTISEDLHKALQLFFFLRDNQRDFKLLQKILPGKCIATITHTFGNSKNKFMYAIENKETVGDMEDGAGKEIASMFSTAKNAAKEAGKKYKEKYFKKNWRTVQPEEVGITL